MAYLDYPGLSYFKSLLDETYLRASYTGDTTIAGDVTFTGDTVFFNDITGNVDGKVKKDWRGQSIDSTYIKDISTNDNVGQITYTKGDGTSNYVMIDMMQGATASAVGKAGLVPAPTISERTKFLRGDGEWGVPTDVYVTQNLINTNDSFPILIGATAGAVQSQVGTAIAFGTRVSVNPNTHTLIADHLILKHPTYRRNNNISSKIMYTLNFADSDDGNGNNLSEIYGYIDPAANGGEHELGFRLFGNPNVQGVEEIFTYLSVGLSKTNIPYGHAPSTPLPADHNEGTDIITRDWLARNGSETGLVHTSMNEAIDGIKTFTNETKNTSTAGITTTKLTASGKITGTGTAEISGGSGNTPSLKVTGNETVTGDSNVGGNSSITGNETVGGNISTTNGTISGKTGSIGSGGLTVAGTTTSTGKITGNGGAEINGGSGLKVNGNETVTGTTTVTGKVTANGGVEVNGGNGLVVNGDETVNGEIYKIVNNTPQEYVSYITNTQETRNTIITNVVKPNGGLAVVSSGTDKGKIYVNTGDGLTVDNNGKINVDFKELDPGEVESIVKRLIDPDGAIVPNTDTYIPKNTTYHYYDANGNLQEATTTSRIANPNKGKLTINFGKIDEDTKADILSSLDLQYPLINNLQIYVNPTTDNATDDLFYVDEDNRNKAYTFAQRKVLPFKTISGAVNWVSTRVSIGKYNIYINVFPGIYVEQVSLPELSITTGSATIRPYTSSSLGAGKTVVIVNPKYSTNDGRYSSCISASSGACEWTIENIKCYVQYEPTTVAGHVHGGIGAGISGANIILTGTDCYVSPPLERFDIEDGIVSDNYMYKNKAHTLYVKNGIKYLFETVTKEFKTPILDNENNPVLDNENNPTYKIATYEYQEIVIISTPNLSVFTDAPSGKSWKSQGIRIISADQGGHVTCRGSTKGWYIESHLPSDYNDAVALTDYSNFDSFIDITALNVSRNGIFTFQRINMPSNYAANYDTDYDNAPMLESDAAYEQKAKEFRTCYMYGSANVMFNCWQSGSTTTYGGAGEMFVFANKDSNDYYRARRFALTSGSTCHKSSFVFPGYPVADESEEITREEQEDGQTVTNTYTHYYRNRQSYIDASTYCWMEPLYTIEKSVSVTGGATLDHNPANDPVEVKHTNG